jgi:hypothetical protein
LLDTCIFSAILHFLFNFCSTTCICLLDHLTFSVARPKQRQFPTSGYCTKIK